jgi:L-arabinose isomerase
MSDEDFDFRKSLSEISKKSTIDDESLYKKIHDLLVPEDSVGLLVVYGDSVEKQGIGEVFITTKEVAQDTIKRIVEGTTDQWVIIPSVKKDEEISGAFQVSSDLKIVKMIDLAAKLDH